MRNDVTSGVTSGVSNVTLKLLKKNGIITKSDISNAHKFYESVEEYMVKVRNLFSL